MYLFQGMELSRIVASSNWSSNPPPPYLFQSKTCSEKKSKRKRQHIRTFTKTSKTQTQANTQLKMSILKNSFRHMQAAGVSVALTAPYPLAIADLKREQLVVAINACKPDTLHRFRADLCIYMEVCLYSANRPAGTASLFITED